MELLHRRLLKSHIDRHLLVVDNHISGVLSIFKFTLTEQRDNLVGVILSQVNPRTNHSFIHLFHSNQSSISLIQTSQASVYLFPFIANSGKKNSLGPSLSSGRNILVTRVLTCVITECSIVNHSSEVRSSCRSLVSFKANTL